MVFVSERVDCKSIQVDSRSAAYINCSRDWPTDGGSQGTEMVSNQNNNILIKLLTYIRYGDRIAYNELRNSMRCVCCNSIFVPSILYNPDGSFNSFEKYCPKCIEASIKEAPDVEVEKDWYVNILDIPLYGKIDE